MNPTTPAIVAQSAVRRLPRVALLAFCLAYLLPGFIGREPWKTADMLGFAYMYELARGASDWLAPTLMGRPPEFDALLPYWLGAWAIRLAPAGLPADLAARLPFMGLLALALAATWHATYRLARAPAAQPVAFAFGGEAQPTDYARALADAGLLALVACLGLAQFSHETTPSLAQLAFATLAFHGLAGVPSRRPAPWLSLAAGLPGLALSGAPTLAVLFAVGGAAVLLLQPAADDAPPRRQRAAAAAIVVAALAVAALASVLDLWRWRLDLAPHDLRGWARLLAWFTWPAGPLALWTLWRWRARLRSRHVALPLWIALTCLGSALLTDTPDRSLLLALPALAALAAFALPTLERGVASAIDWFTLLFFSGIALVIWVVWISLQTGVPAQPAANVARLAVGYQPSFSLPAFAAALAATLAWAALVRWRAGRHRAAIWKSMVLPAGGIALCWMLMMTLWLPVLDYARSYGPSARAVQRALDRPGCVEAVGLTAGQVTALRYHGGLDVRAPAQPAACPWRVAGVGATPEDAAALQLSRWNLVTTVRRPTDANDTLRVYRAPR